MTGDKSNHFQLYYNQIKSFPVLNFEQEQEMAGKIQEGDEKIKQRLVESNLRLVVKIARTYANSGISLLDLIQEGNIGLIYAAERYDPEKQVRFSTYASWWIKQRILRYFSNKKRIIRLPYSKEEMLRKIQYSRVELTHKLNRIPKTREIATELGISESDIGTVLSLTSNMVSLDHSEPEFGGILDHHEDYSYNPEQELLREDSKKITRKMLNTLKDREKNILMYRYQLKEGEGHTLRKISAKIGVSQETVRQIANKALQKIRSNPELKKYMD